MPTVRGRLEMCEKGYHLMRNEAVLEWLGSRLFIAEAVAEILRDVREKLCCTTARLIQEVTTWNERIARLFACDCAEHVQPPDADPCSLACIAVARRFANGEAIEQELRESYLSAHHVIYNNELAGAHHAAYYTAYGNAYMSVYYVLYQATTAAVATALAASGFIVHDDAYYAACHIFFKGSEKWQYKHLCKMLGIKCCWGVDFENEENKL